MVKVNLPGDVDEEELSFSRNNLIDYSSLSDEIYVTNISFT